MSRINKETKIQKIAKKKMIKRPRERTDFVMNLSSTFDTFKEMI